MGNFLAGANSEGQTWGADASDAEWESAAAQVQAGYATAARPSQETYSNIANLKAGFGGIVGKPSAELSVALTQESLAQKALVPGAPIPGNGLYRSPSSEGITTNVLPGIRDSSEIPGVARGGKASNFYWLAAAGIVAYFAFKRWRIL